VTANLLEGRVAILADNTPLALIVPTTFWMLLQAPGDYYQAFWVGTAFRWIRFIAFLVALTIPALYVMLATFHQEMIPTPMALNVAGGREGTPLPTLVEVLLMTFLFEVLNEAGLRLPQAVGQSVSIVGGLVVGQAAVQAGLVAPATVIVVATAGLNAFALPSYSLSLTLRVVRVPLLLATGFLGVFGFIGVTSVLALHAASLRSFGEPFLAPIAPVLFVEQQDTLVRAPWFNLLKRPRLGQSPNTDRQPAGQMPSPRNDQGAGKP
ncbi:MAG: spore germination protein, partial [Mycobacterium leprae]